MLIASLNLVATAQAGAPEDEELRAAIEAPLALANIVDEAIGGATSPEVAAAPFQKALRLLATVDKSRFAKRYRKIADGIEATLFGKDLGRSNLSRGFSCHRPLVGQLKGSRLRLPRNGALKEPMEGGEDLGTKFEALAMIVAASGIDALNGGRIATAKKSFDTLVRAGQLLEGPSRTYSELAASWNMVRQGLNLLYNMAGRSRPPRADEADRLRVLRVKLSKQARGLSLIRKGMRDQTKVAFWAELAATHARALWKNVALEALALLARRKEGGPARKALKILAERSDPVGLGAKIKLARLR